MMEEGIYVGKSSITMHNYRLEIIKSVLEKREQKICMIPIIRKTYESCKLDNTLTKRKRCVMCKNQFSICLHMIFPYVISPLMMLIEFLMRVKRR